MVVQTWFCYISSLCCGKREKDFSSIVYLQHFSRCQYSLNYKFYQKSVVINYVLSAVLKGDLGLTSKEFPHFLFQMYRRESNDFLVFGQGETYNLWPILPPTSKSSSLLHIL